MESASKPLPKQKICDGEANSTNTDVGSSRGRSLEAAHASSARVSYMSLPNKGQLFLLMLTRMTESLVSSSIQSYLFFQLRFFDPSASAELISAQAGLIIGARTAAHVCTGMVWGRLADSALVGRRVVLVFGLVASTIAIFGYGFSASFTAALAWQILDGALNSTIPMVRCIIAELNPQKRQRARALTLLPLCANAGHLLGPLIGGFLASPGTQHSKHGGLQERFPFAAPNIVIGAFHAILALVTIFGLEETLEGSRKPALWRSLIRRSSPSPPNEAAHRATHETAPLLSNDGHNAQAGIHAESSEPDPADGAVRPSFWQIWTFNVVATLLAYFVIHGHMGTFPVLWAIFLSSPSSSPGDASPSSTFGGGLGMDTRGVGVAMSLQGAIGVIMQVLLYPTLNDKLGTIRLWRSGLLIFPLMYFVAPMAGVVTNLTGNGKTDAPIHASIRWISVIFILFLYVCGRAGVAPANTLLINESTPHPSMRGTIHTAATIVSSLSRSIFPPITLLIFGHGLRIGFSALGFWFLAVLASLACVASLWVMEGNNEDS